MKTIKRPADIALANQGRPILKEDKAPVAMSFRDFLSLVFETDARCQATFEAARRAARIDAAAIGDEPEIKVHEEDWRWLLEILKTTALPTLPMRDGSRCAIGRQLLPFMDAIEAAALPPAPAGEPTLAASTLASSE